MCDDTLDNKRMKASGGNARSQWWRLPVPAALSWSFANSRRPTCDV